MKAEIISIGNELLIGDILNTNATWMGAFMTEHGFDVSRVYTIPDDIIQIKQSISASLSESDLVLCTGGLGPTHDDITKKAISELFGMKMRRDREVLDFVQKYFAQRNIPFSASNFGQADVPEGCEILFNNKGTAPGMWFNIGGKYLAVMPGVPHEMQFLMNNRVAPKIQRVFGSSTFAHSRYIKTAGVGESTLSDLFLGNIEPFLKVGVKMAFLPHYGSITLRLDGKGASPAEARNSVQPLADYIYEHAGDVIFGEGKEYTLSEALGAALKEKGRTLATAESCTGGLIANEITNTPGSSAYFQGGITAYANAVKEKVLGIPKKDIETHGAVSKTVALQMAKNAAGVLSADIGVSTTGIAGPDGGSAGKPVGTVWIGFWSPEEHFAVKTVFAKDRLVNKERAAVTAMELVRRQLKGIVRMPYNMEKQLP